MIEVSKRVLDPICYRNYKFFHFFNQATLIYYEAPMNIYNEFFPIFSRTKNSFSNFGDLN
jgi:hypothetical protein